MSKRLLIIEDELLIAAMTEDVAKSYGYEVEAIAQNLTDAMHLARNSYYDLAIVDINLGSGLEGLEVGS
ncbi:MAG: response regulator, partial [Sphingobacteriales bacterium]